MTIFGLTITRTKTLALQSVESRGGWWPIVREGLTGSWQRNIEIRLDNVLTHPTVFACITLIASDIGKMCLNLVHETKEGIWEETDNPAYSPVLRKPNRYQTIGKFIEQWIFSKLIWGNTYVLKQRDQRGVVVGLYILDPNRVRVLVAEDGSVYYEMMRDTLSNLPRENVVAPAREIIHDPMYTLYHPLVGLPPLHASGLLATLGLNIVTNSANLFGNGSQPGGILTAPAGITDTQAAALKAAWETAFSGANYGKVAVLGGELKYEPLSVPAEKTQLTEQWGKTSESIATTFHVPFHFVGGPLPPYNNVQTLTVQYFTQCLQSLCKQLETVLDEGLGLGPQFGNDYGTEFDIDDLLWMDSLTMMSVIKDGVGAAVFTPNEGRQMRNLPPVEGGNTPYLQEQNWPLRLLSQREVPTRQPTAPEPMPPGPADPSMDKGLHLTKSEAHMRFRIRRQRAA